MVIARCDECEVCEGHESPTLQDAATRFYIDFHVEYGFTPPMKATLRALGLDPNMTVAELALLL